VRSQSLQSPNGKYVACGAVDGLVTVFEVRDGKRLHSIEGSSAQRTLINQSLSLFAFAAEASWYSDVRVRC
jgi:hypothetical protein